MAGPLFAFHPWLLFLPNLLNKLILFCSQNSIQSNLSWGLTSIYIQSLLGMWWDINRWQLSVSFFVAPQVYEWNPSNEKTRKSELANVILSQNKMKVNVRLCHFHFVIRPSSCRWAQHSLKITIVINVCNSGQTTQSISRLPCCVFCTYMYTYMPVDNDNEVPQKPL